MMKSQKRDELNEEDKRNEIKETNRKNNESA